MSLFFKAHEELLTHPKFLKVLSQRYGKEAVGAWFMGACWCAGHLSDGFFPDTARKFLGITPKSAGLLVDAGLWEESLEGFQYHDWLDHNPSKESILSAREGSARRAAKSRRNGARAATIDTDRDTDRDTDTPERDMVGVSASLKSEVELLYGEWCCAQGLSAEPLLGKNLDAVAKRVDAWAKANELTLRQSVAAHCKAAADLPKTEDFAWRLRKAQPQIPMGALL